MGYILWNHHLLDIIAILKCIISDILKTVRQLNCIQILTSIKCTIRNLCYTLRNIDIMQVATGLECSGSDGLQSSSLKYHLIYIWTAIECISSYLLQCFWHNNSYITTILFRFSEILQVWAIIKCIIRYYLNLCFWHIKYDIRTICKWICADRCYTCRKLDLNIVIICKRISSYLFQLGFISKGNGSKIVTFIKCIITDRLHRIRNADLPCNSALLTCIWIDHCQLWWKRIWSFAIIVKGCHTIQNLTILANQ